MTMKWLMPALETMLTSGFQTFIQLLIGKLQLFLYGSSRNSFMQGISATQQVLGLAQRHLNFRDENMSQSRKN